MGVIVKFFGMMIIGVIFAVIGLTRSESSGKEFAAFAVMLTAFIVLPLI